MNKRNIFVFVFLTVLSFLLLRDLFRPGFYTSHDGPHQVVRMYYFDQALREGQIPPRWAGGLLNGFGYPLFIFSYHVPWAIAEIFRLAGFDIFMSIKLTFLTGFILSGCTMFLFLKRVFSFWPALLGALVYLLAPYRFSNIFVRAAIGDATVFIFLPVFFLSLFNLKSGDKKTVIWITTGAVAFSLMLLSHAMVFLLAVCCAFLYVLVSLPAVKKKLHFLKNTALTAILGFVLSAYYFLPSVVERNYTKFTSLMSSVFSGTTFLTLQKLIYSPWGYGTVDAKEGAMSLQIGIVQWLAVITALVTIVYVLIRKRKFKPESTDLEGLYFLAIFLFTVFAMLPVSSFFWNIMYQIAVVDFVWRILPLSVFSASVLACYVMHRWKYKPLIFAAFLFLAFYGNRNHLRINQTLDWDVPFFLKLERTTNTYGEYTPRWVDSGTIAVEKQKIEYSDPSAKIFIRKQIGNELRFSLEATREGMLTINTVYYPGWKITDNGSPQEYDKSKGIFQLKVAPGKHEYVMEFRETPLRLASDMISVGGILTLGMLLYKDRKKFNDKSEATNKIKNRNPKS